MEQIKIPDGYQSSLNLHDTQIAIKTVKDFFQQTLAQKLNLLRVSAPVFVNPSSGLNDNLNGVERPVSFDIKGQPENAEIVHSLAKWKRYALQKYGFAHGEGLYTDMIAIRRDEDLDNIHSVYVDQWDWEKIISKEERNMDTLVSTVRAIYSVLRKTEKYMAVQYDYIEEILPREIAFVSTQELVDMYPDLTPKEREYKIVKEKGAVFLMQVGKTLTNGERHDGRAPDYDDWELNGDILVYYPVLDIALELLPWVSALTRMRLTDSLPSQDVMTDANFLSRKQSLTKNFHILSAAASASPVSVCSSSEKHTSVKYMLPCGRKK